MKDGKTISNQSEINPSSTTTNLFRLNSSPLFCTRYKYGRRARSNLVRSSRMIDIDCVDLTLPLHPHHTRRAIRCPAGTGFLWEALLPLLCTWYCVTGRASPCSRRVLQPRRSRPRHLPGGDSPHNRPARYFVLCCVEYVD